MWCGVSAAIRVGFVFVCMSGTETAYRIGLRLEIGANIRNEMPFIQRAAVGNIASVRGKVYMFVLAKRY